MVGHVLSREKIKAIKLGNRMFVNGERGRGKPKNKLVGVIMIHSIREKEGEQEYSFTYIQ